MLEEMIKKIQTMAEDGLRPYVVDIDPGNPRIAYFWNPATKQIEIKYRMPLSRNHAVATLDSLAGTFDRYASHYEPSVWCSLKSVIAVFDDGSNDEEADPPRADGYRLHKITLPVTPSTIFDAVNSLPVKQKDLLFAIRHSLKPSKIAPPNFEEAISSLRWERSSVSEGAIGTVKSTMGRSSSAELKTQLDIPPEIAVTFEPFPALAKHIQAAITVNCSVTVDAENETISIRPYPGQVDAAKFDAVELLRATVMEVLKSDENTVFAGTP